MQLVYFFPVFGALGWGLNYAITGQFIKQFTFAQFFLLYALSNLMIAVLLCVGRKQSLVQLFSFRFVGVSWGWITLMLVAAASSVLLNYYTMRRISPTYVAVCEISYPLFVPLFSWLLFRQAQLTPGLVVGGALILLGAAIVTLTGAR